MKSRIGMAALKAIAAVLLAGVAPCALSAQTLNDALQARSAGESGKDRLLVEAGELQYDNDRNTVSAVGDVHLYYQGRTLQADRVTYDRASRRVFATGNARITEADGTVITGDRFELTDDFRDGFIDSLRVQRTGVIEGKTVTTRFAAPRAERAGGEAMVFEKGTYTACEPCADHPERPPLWQVRAAKIIHKNQERMIYYEDATLEFIGVPMAYAPFMSAPDPTVRRKSGFLAPRFVASTATGYGVAIPYFINIAPNMDVTLTPTFMTRQGVLGQAEFRHRLETGSYNVRAAGIFQRDRDAFLPSPLGPRDKEFRGSIESAGRFYLNEKWQYGWDVALVTDKWFLDNYKIKSESLSTTYFRESTSTVFLTGKGDRGYFDLRGYYFKGLSSLDWQKQQPVVHPALEYNRAFDGPDWLGGQITLDANVTSLSRDQAYFQQTPNMLNNWLGYYSNCAIYEKGRCIMRGMPGTYTRATAGALWKRRFIDPFGQVWTPFASLRADVTWTRADVTGALNQHVPNFIDPASGPLGRVMPAVGLEYRYPFVATTASGVTHTIEPVAQIVARPNETRLGKLPNEDAQSLVFDDTTLFEYDKFSGYDRVEGGVRLNYGLKYALTTAGGGYVDALFGQSVQLAGRNSFSEGYRDPTNTGLESGLDRKASDYVGRLHLQPSRRFAFTARGRFDQESFALKRMELTSSVSLGAMQASLTYGHYAAQPSLGYAVRRQGLAPTLSYQVTPNWRVHGSMLFDLSAQKNAQQYFVSNPLTGRNYLKAPYGSLASASIGVQYQDECATFGVVYTSSYNDPTTGVRSNNQSVMVRLELTTLGAVQLSQTLGDATSGGVAQ
ncbi:LPS-assembly protein LptD [Camelimonas abortus]|uniref:LPS-assembly protein LptD n=1 Tax=Camelimonas abortus TaxID=1017184 RepID=A0ABV7LFI8_9HYPH